MSATSYTRGHKIIHDGDVWRFADDGSLTAERPCAKCQLLPTAEGFDACIGKIEGAMAACCGHGVEPPYVLRQDGAA